MVSAKSGTMVSGDSFIYCRVKWPIFSGFNFKMQISSISFFSPERKTIWYFIESCLTFLWNFWRFCMNFFKSCHLYHTNTFHTWRTHSVRIYSCVQSLILKKNVGSAYFIWCAMFYSIPFIVYNSDYFIIINTGNVHVFYKICHFISSINRVSITFFAPFLPMMRNSI